MSNSKHAHYRYNILAKCFRRRERPFSFQELLDEVNFQIAEVYPGEEISIRTLRDDICLFRDEKRIRSYSYYRTILRGRCYIYSGSVFSVAKNIDNSCRNNISEFLKNKSFVFILMLLFLITFRL